MAEVSTHLTADPDRTPEVHLKLVFGLFIGNCFYFPGETIPGVINNDITTAEMGFDLLEGVFDLVIRGYIQLYHKEFLGRMGRNQGCETACLPSCRYDLMSRCKEYFDKTATRTRRCSGYCKITILRLSQLKTG
jgi:hypothetical protein